MIRTRTSLVLTLAAALAACAKAPPPPADTSEADAAVIRQAGEDWLASFNAGDAEALGATYTEDAVSLPPDGAPVVGREAIVQSLTEFFTQFSATQTSTVDEVAVFGDLAMARGTWSTSETPKAGGAEQARNGKWLELMKRQADGSWKTWRWMWNEARSAAEAGGM